MTTQPTGPTHLAPWWLDGHTGGIRDQHRRRVNGKEILARLEEQQRALHLVLAYASGEWTDGDVAMWTEVTGTDETTFNVMCDHIRKVLGR